MIYDLAIIGGGVWGSAAAQEAVRAGGKSVLLLEKGIGLAQESSAKSGGILTDLLWHPEDQEFVTRSRVLYREARELSGDASVAREFGQLTLAEREYADQLHRREADLSARGVRFEMIGKDEIERRYPNLDRLREGTVGMWTPDDWHVNPTAFAQAVVDRAREGGLTLRAGCRAETIHAEDQKVVIEAGGERFEAARVLVSAGTWSRKLVRTAGFDIAMRPYRVQLSSLQLAQPHALPIVWHLQTDVYMVPEGPQNILAGDGTRLWEHDPDDYQQTGDDEFRMNIAERLLDLSSLGDSAGLRSSWAGLGGATPDRRPLLGPLTERLFTACGDNGIGVMRGPAVGELAARVALGLAEVPHLRPDRFPPTDFEIRPGFTLD
ncbi:MAG: FAD-dependent oxidoreductase [Thermaerobacter sp.]|nr:FAD-dependent oxidoreductase [Thermaerobacter sp.]